MTDPTCGVCPSCMAGVEVDHGAIGGVPDVDCTTCGGTGVEPGDDGLICACVVEYVTSACCETCLFNCPD